jgi:diacylglycerol kinase (ATP)
VKALGCALNGIAHAWRTQKSLRIQVALGIGAAIVCAALHVPAGGFAILALTIAVVLAFEVMNTALEALVDLASPQIHPLAKVAKDAAAGAVLIAAAGAVAVGAFVVWQAGSSR